VAGARPLMTCAFGSTPSFLRQPLFFSPCFAFFAALARQLQLALADLHPVLFSPRLDFAARQISLSRAPSGLRGIAMDDFEVEFDFEDELNADVGGQPTEAPQSMPANARKNYRQVRDGFEGDPKPFKPSCDAISRFTPSRLHTPLSSLVSSPRRVFTCALPSPPHRLLLLHQTVCRHWLRGLCMKGNNCGFLHQFDKQRMPTCRFYAKYNECKEPDCPFKHSLEDVKDCNMFKLGFCIHGPNCRYRHAPTSQPPATVAEAALIGRPGHLHGGERGVQGGMGANLHLRDHLSASRGFFLACLTHLPSTHALRLLAASSSSLSQVNACAAVCFVRGVNRCPGQPRKTIPPRGAPR